MRNADIKPTFQTDFSAEEAELSKLREEAIQQPEKPAPEAEELAEESRPSEEPKDSNPDGEKKPESSDAHPKIDTPIEEPETELSPRGKKRFNEIIEKRKEAEARANQLQAERDSLYQTIEALKQQGYTQRQAEEISEQVDTEGFVEKTPQEYQADIARQAEIIVDRKLRQKDMEQQSARAAEYFQEDLKFVEKEYPLLNPDTENYDAKLETFIGNYYKNLLKENPMTRLKDVVKEVMELREQAVAEGKERTVKKVAKQASQQAIAPSVGKADPVPTLEDELKNATTDAELEAIKNKINQGA